MRVAVLLACGLIAGCTTVSHESSPAAKATTKRSLTAEEVATVQEGVRKSLKDPNSAMFGPMTGAQEGNDHTWVCGVVNARNSFGGYTGDKPFMGMLVHMLAGGKTLKMFQVTGMGGTDSETYATMEMCRRYGVVS